ncbi:hypothetical protein BDZ85DRAFT_260425 [Elsinoe ampelina]|uniref:Uncharacterized protein n=1 Tax=Elsinoe ampelina TaxID=302913 RepID=A0A6A6GFC1_9PEZI|nr:hypothetical protein BDZ85DRAFT_260425 [Elsinoe ampelina]
MIDRIICLPQSLAQQCTVGNTTGRAAADYENSLSGGKSLTGASRLHSGSIWLHLDVFQAPSDLVSRLRLTPQATVFSPPFISNITNLPRMHVAPTACIAQETNLERLKRATSAAPLYLVSNLPCATDVKSHVGDWHSHITPPGQPPFPSLTLSCPVRTFIR